jgi:hypothetical protein
LQTYVLACTRWINVAIMNEPNDKRVALGARVPSDVAKAVREQAAMRDVSVSRVIIDSLRKVCVPPEVQKK